MGILDRIRPQSGLAHADAEQRLHAVQHLPAAELALLHAVVRGDADPRVRRAAVRRLRDAPLLAEAAARDTDPSVREAASSALLGMALEDRDEATALLALEGLGEGRHLTSVARSAALESVSRAALARLSDDRARGNVARHGEHAAVRLEALALIGDERELLHVTLKAETKEMALQALERLSDPEALGQVAERARNRAAARRARARLKGGEGEDAGETARPSTDRPAQERLCEAAEALARSEDWDDLAARIAGLQDSWIEDIPEVDDDLDGRFQEACRAARRRLAEYQEERLLRERRERALEEVLAPRRVLCEQVESTAPDAGTAVVGEARAAWELLAGSESPEAELLAKRFEAACAEVLERHTRLLQSESLAQEQARAERQSREEERRKKENAQRLERLGVQTDKLLALENAPLAKLERALRDVKSALLSSTPLPTQKEQDQMAQRLRALQTQLVPRVQTVRDTDRFQRWANAAVQEELCARMEDLAGRSEEPEASASDAARGLRELMERWKAAGPAPPEQSLQLWNRFKTARDRVRARCDAFHALQIEEQARNLETKQALCVKAEELAASTDWTKTTEAIKALQIEWKAVGQASRGQEKAVWDRFRRACDQFFARRDEELSRRKDEWAKNLEAKKALCEKAEGLADSTDWKSAASELKKLQADWKAIGTVKRSQSDAIWNRFRAACDRFFERYKNRDNIERQALAAEREALCGEIEALAPIETAEAPAAPPEGLVGRLREGLERWQRMRGLPPDVLGPLQSRFFGAFDRVILAYPQAVEGTSLDPEANRRRMEELCTRVEKLGAGQEAPVPVADLSPAARLAAQWREALASNTMGGRVAEESRIRAAAEEARKAQAAWQRLGYVAEPSRRALSERFERACRRILDHPAANQSMPGEPPARRKPGRAGAASRR